MGHAKDGWIEITNKHGASAAQVDHMASSVADDIDVMISNGQTFIVSRSRVIPTTEIDDINDAVMDGGSFALSDYADIAMSKVAEINKEAMDAGVLIGGASVSMSPNARVNFVGLYASRDILNYPFSIDAGSGEILIDSKAQFDTLMQHALAFNIGRTSAYGEAIKSISLCADNKCIDNVVINFK